MLDNYPDKTEWTRTLYPVLWQIDLAFRLRDEKALVEGLRNLSTWMDQDYANLSHQRRQKALAERHHLRRYLFGLDAYEDEAFEDEEDQDHEDRVHAR